MQIDKIYNENCLDTMSKMPNNFIDIIVTSPPYNIIRPNSTDRGYDIYKDGMSNDEYIEWTLDIFKSFNKVLKDNGVILYNMSYGSENTVLMNLVIADIIRKSNFTLADIIIWKKKSATPNNVSHNKLTRIVEYVYVFCKKDDFYTFNANKKILSRRETNQPIYENVFNFITADNNDESNELNKATFSTEFVRKLFSIYASPNSLVYDPFMGSGTTAKASIIDKHHFIGSEISKKQIEYSEKRIQPYLKQKTLF